MKPDKDPQLEAMKDRGWEIWAAIDRALEQGEITEEEWHRRIAAVIVPAYLSAGGPRAGSGQNGDAAHWEHTRRSILKGVNRSGTFLDIGCANGHLMETLHAWASEDGIALEPYGLEIAPELAELARRRLPQWADRIWVGNALHWIAPSRFDFVRTGLEYVPARRRPDLIRHLLETAVAPGGRLIIGMFTEEAEQRFNEEEATAWGFNVTGRYELPHRDPRLMRRVFWIE